MRRTLLVFLATTALSAPVIANAAPPLVYSTPGQPHYHILNDDSDNNDDDDTTDADIQPKSAATPQVSSKALPAIVSTPGKIGSFSSISAPKPRPSGFKKIIAETGEGEVEAAPAPLSPPEKPAAKTPEAKPLETKPAEAKPAEPKTEAKPEPKAEVKPPAPAVQPPIAGSKAPEIKPNIVKVTTNTAPAAAVAPAAGTPEVAPLHTDDAIKSEAKPAAKAEKEKPKAEAKGGKSATPKAEFSKDGDIEHLKFTFSSQVPAAIFERFGYYWLVFYTDDQINLPDSFKKSQLFASSKKITAVKTENLNPDNFPKTVTSPLIFNLELAKTAYAMAEKKDNQWDIQFDPNIKFEPENPLKPLENPNGWDIPTKGISGRIGIKDEFTNDYIDVFPLSEPGAITDNSTTAKFVLEKTVQGIVMKPIGQVDAKADEKDKIKLLPQGGLAPAKTAAAAVDSSGKSPDKIDTGIKKPDTPSNPIYPFKKWLQLQGEDYRKQDLKLKNGDRFEYGKFLFTQGLYSEAAVNLEGVKGFDASFLTAASYYMTARYEDALKIFNSLSVPDGVNPNELLMWKIATNFELSQVNPSAADDVNASNFYVTKNLDSYPDAIRDKLLFSLAEKAINDGKFDDAQGYLDMLPKAAIDPVGQSYIKYLQAKIYDRQDKHARAREIWSDVAKAKTDRESQAKSAFEVIMQDYNSNKIKLDEAIKQLNGIRIIWRGDIFEYKLLSQLADFYVKNGDTYEALKTYKEILSSFPNYPNNLQIASKMRDIYQQVMDKQFADKDKAFSAVTIYYEFEELKPVGAKGDQITLQLSDALARYDLLDDATKVLQKYFATLTDAGQKGEIGTRIAILQYMNSKPKDALQSLKDSDSPGLPNYLTQERRILQVRCLIEVGDLEKAMSLLSALPDQQANRFKADIYWKEKKWQEMVDVYAVVPEKSDEDIMRLGIAYVLLDDKKALKDLYKQYGDRMAKSQYAQSFEFVTDTDNVDFRNLDTSLKLDKTQELVQKYRERIKNSGLESVTGKNASAPAPKK